MSNYRLEHTVEAMFGIQGRVVAITGGCGGIGSGVGEVLSELGAKIAILDLHGDQAAAKAAEIEKKSGNMVRGYGADVTDEASVEAAFAQIQEDFGSVYGLINCAGISHVAPLIHMPMDAWQRVIDVNLRGTVICAKVAQKYMRLRREGRIINISSLASTHGKVGYTAYTPSKSAVDGFTFTLAMELARLHITVNAIAPVFVLTDINRRQWADRPDIEATVAEENPMGEICDPEKIAGLAAFLLSPAAWYINGELIGCNGGLTHGLMNPRFPQERYPD